LRLRAVLLWNVALLMWSLNTGLCTVHVEFGEGAWDLPQGDQGDRVAVLHCILCERVLHDDVQQARHVSDGAEHAVQRDVQVPPPLSLSM